MTAPDWLTGCWRRRPGVHLLMALLLLGSADRALAQQQYRIDGGGGPLTAAEDVAAAADAWNNAAADVMLEEASGATTVIRFGAPEAMGPDLVSLTLVPEEGGGFEVVLHPELYRANRAALLHELGLLIGLPATGSGVMSPWLQAGAGEDASGLLGEEERTALTNLRERVTGDLTGDGKVDLADLAAFGRAYGQQGVNLAADLDGSGAVDAVDLDILRAAYEFTAPAPSLTDSPSGSSNSSTNPSTDAKPDSEPETELETEPDAEPDALPETEPDGEPDAVPETEPEPEPETEGEPDSEP